MYEPEATTTEATTNTPNVPVSDGQTQTAVEEAQGQTAPAETTQEPGGQPVDGLAEAPGEVIGTTGSAEPTASNDQAVSSFSGYNTESSQKIPLVDPGDIVQYWPKDEDFSHVCEAGRSYPLLVVTLHPDDSVDGHVFFAGHTEYKTGVPVTNDPEIDGVPKGVWGL